MERDEIWQLILRADELVKYSADEGTPRRGQAVELLVRALEAAETAGDRGLAVQTRVRLEDLGAEAPPAQG